MPTERLAEWEDLQNESRLLKKLKKGKISDKEFDRMVGDASDSEDGDSGDE
jgi:hypothetical protein